MQEDPETESMEFVQHGDQASFGTGMSTDPILYQEVKRRAEAGEFIDFKLPDDSNAPTLRQRLGKMNSTKPETPTENENSSDYERVNPAEVFGGDSNA